MERGDGMRYIVIAIWCAVLIAPMMFGNIWLQSIAGLLTGITVGLAADRVMGEWE